MKKDLKNTQNDELMSNVNGGVGLGNEASAVKKAYTQMGANNDEAAKVKKSYAQMGVNVGETETVQIGYTGVDKNLGEVNGIIDPSEKNR